MKKILLLIFVCGSIFHSNAQDTKNPDAIVGVWLTGSKEGKVEIFKKGNSYLGKIVWMKEPNDPKTGNLKTDKFHPDEKLHTRPILGLTNLWGFVFKNENTWEEGHIYDPKNGKEYKCIISFKDKNTLNVRGYIGISLIGRTETWLRSSL